REPSGMRRRPAARARDRAWRSRAGSREARGVQLSQSMARDAPSQGPPRLGGPTSSVRSPASRVACYGGPPMVPAETALLRVPGFARFASVAALNTLTFSGEQVVLGWLVLDITNSPLLVGVALALRVVPMLFVGLPAGVLADRGDRLVLLRGANSMMALALTSLGTLATLGRATIGSILVITFFDGCARALQQVAQQVHTHDLVGPMRL